MSWRCHICGEQLEEPPTCFGSEPPWRALVSEQDFDSKVELTADQCVVEKRAFFVRGHIEIPILQTDDHLVFSVWSSLSEQSFRHMTERWHDADRSDDPPYFGWLSSVISVYPDTVNLKLAVQSCAPGVVPIFRVRTDSHPLAIDQRNGITVGRWHKLAHELLEHFGDKPPHLESQAAT